MLQYNTLVTGFLNNVNNRTDRNLNYYYNLVVPLLKTDIPKLIFVDIEMYYKIIKNTVDIRYTYFIKYNTDKGMFKHSNKITNFNVNTDNPNKDTINYMLTNCNKTEWIKEAINLNPFNTKYFIWVDFGIKHIFNCSDDEFITKINNLQYKKYNNIRIGNIWNLNYNSNLNIYKDIHWYFAGGIFGGNTEALLFFAEKMEEFVNKIIEQKKSIMWETNIWYLIYKTYPEIFNPYYCDHNNTLVDCY